MTAVFVKRYLSRIRYWDEAHMFSGTKSSETKTSNSKFFWRKET